MNQLIHGDACKVLMDIQTESVDGVFTDPPFNVNLKPQRKTHDGIDNDDLSPTEFYDMVGTVFVHLHRVMKPNAVAWICCDWHCAGQFDEWLRRFGFEVKTWVVWCKNNFGLGYHFRPQHEFIIAAFKGEPAVPEKAISNVWHVARLNETIHPNEKPIELIQTALRQYNEPGDIILDPFAGSFSTCIAAKLLGMNYIGVESNLDYYENGCKRLAGEVLRVKNKKGVMIERDETSAMLDLL